jgi:hypothetical protein
MFPLTISSHICLVTVHTCDKVHQTYYDCHCTIVDFISNQSSVVRMGDKVSCHSFKITLGPIM